MSSNLIFVDRRQGQERREQDAPAAPAAETPHKPRKVPDRRARARSLLEDYYAYMRKYLGKTDYAEPSRAGKLK